MSPLAPVLIYSSIQLVRVWIDHCINHHEECGKRELASVFPDSAEILLIDVKELRLVKTTTTMRYLALSYVWGQIPQFTTRVENLESLLQPDSLRMVLPDIPTVIKDAIQLANELKERFLWVDSLCIVQDDASIKHSQLALMAEIYNSATATIIACAGSDARTGLHRYSRPIPVRAVWSNPNYQPDREDYPFILNTGIHRPREPSHFDERISRSHHNQRGWTYQERLLSRRRIYFFDNEIIFHCRSDMFAEHGTVDVKRVRDFRYMRGVRWSIDIQSAFEDAVQKHRGHGSEWPSGMTTSSWDIGFQFWSRTIEEYSTKQFTFEKDILDACTGVLQAFQGYSGWMMVQAMPEPVLDLALLWIPTSTMERRLPSTTTDSHLRFPSWSWLGWRGGVTFHLARQKSLLQTSDMSALKYLEKSGKDQHFTGDVVVFRYDRYPKGRPKEPGKATSSQQRDLNIAMSSSYYLRFSTFSLPGSKFKLLDADDDTIFEIQTLLVRGSDPTDKAKAFRLSPWSKLAWLVSKPGLDVCDGLYGLGNAQIQNFNQSQKPGRFELILLSGSSFASLNGSQDFLSFICEQAEEEKDDGAKLSAPTILHVMLIEWDGDIAERVAVGQITSKEWQQRRPQFKTIILG
ncbi:hypothetical protein ACEPPN_010203 [Leptodophora sp. 'Broadleaf-Isolate-01']